MYNWCKIRNFFLTELGSWGRDCAVAGIFLTRLPFPLIKNGNKKGSLATSMRAFPLIGALVGSIAGIVLMSMSALGLSPLASAFVGLAAGILVTGALHEDGLSDVADGLGGGDTVEKKLKIMRDSRIGAYGVLAILFSVGIRATVLGGISSPELAAAIMIAAGAMSRGILPLTISMSKPARKSGLAQRAGTPDQEGWLKALVLGALISFLFLGPFGGLFALVSGVATAWFVAWFCQKQIGGYTGDTLGTVQQSAEVSILIFVASLL